MISSEYAAGLFDGEGSVGFYKYPPRSSLQRVVSISGAWLPTLRAFARQFGGHVYQKKRGAKPVYQWCVYDKSSIVAFLRCVLPHSREKRDQIITALRAIARGTELGEMKTLRAMKRRGWQAEAPCEK